MVGHVAHTRTTRNEYRFSLEILKGGDNFGGLGVAGKIILKWVLTIS